MEMFIFALLFLANLYALYSLSNEIKELRERINSDYRHIESNIDLIPYIDFHINKIEDKFATYEFKKKIEKKGKKKNVNK